MRGPAGVKQLRRASLKATLEAIYLGFYKGILCPACLRHQAMSVPQAAFAVKKIRKNMEKREEFFNGSNNKEETSRYNSKYMNSIWGMYNRFSCHNLKKVIGDHQPQAQATVGQTLKGLANTSSLSVSVERLSYLPL